jgi:NADH:ubiquinone oxidoreductase subunit 2 (subunit N)
MVAWNSERMGMRFLAIGLAVNAAIAAWYYLRLVKTAYLDPPAGEAPALGARTSRVLFSTMGICAAATIGFFFFPNSLMALLWGVQ